MNQPYRESPWVTSDVDPVRKAQAEVLHAIAESILALSRECEAGDTNDEAFVLRLAALRELHDAVMGRETENGSQSET